MNTLKNKSTGFIKHYNKQYKAKTNGGYLLTDTNVKVKAWLFSLPPIKACLNCDSCKDTCYAIKAYEQYPTARALWDYNLNLAKNDLFKLYDRLDEQLNYISNSRMKNKTVRIHQSGDFISQAYINMWYQLAKKYPKISFYGYTKVEHLFDFKALFSLSNVNFVKSVINNKFRNYGSVSYVERIAKKTKAVICPVNYAKNSDDIICGVNCRLCMQDNQNVMFIEH